MESLVECVPNFSEGRDPAVIEAIADAVRRTDGCTLLDVDPGRSTNRTVYTLVFGELERYLRSATAPSEDDVDALVATNVKLSQALWAWCTAVRKPGMSQA